MSLPTALFVLTLSFAAPMPFALAGADGNPLVVVVHPSNATSRITRSQLAVIFKGLRRQWNSELHISLYLPPSDSPAMGLLAEQVFRVPDSNGVSQYYVRAMFQNILPAAPPMAGSVAELLRDVEADRGAIAVVARSDVPAGAAVKVLQLDEY